METSPCIEFQTENSSLDEMGSLDGDDLYSVHVDVEKADPLCMKLANEFWRWSPQPHKQRAG